MSYVLVRTTVHDPAAFEAYRRLAGPSIQAHGGRMLAKGPVLESLEGAESAQRVALIAFDDPETARRWYDSPAYQQAVRARAGVAEMSLTLF
ncbi:MAG: DUF1330 domain-containing protein [Myxococcota bacterium]|nr:DUF1330 domain-containing protein [Myxococcota bacterium]